MKLALFFACGLLSIQALYGTSVAKAFDDEASAWEKALIAEEISELVLESYLDRSDSPLFGLTFINPIGCISAVKDSGKLGFKGWKFVKERVSIHKKGKSGRENCERNPNAEEKAKCLENVNRTHDEELQNLHKDIMAAAPGIVDVIYSVVKCFV